jgi:hypothetical protein
MAGYAIAPVPAPRGSVSQFVDSAVISSSVVTIEVA